MAIGSGLRVEARKSTSRCSNVTLAVFVGLCLIGVWMLTSSTSVSVGVSSEENKPATTGKVSSSGSSPVEDNSGDVTSEIDGGDAEASMDHSAAERKSSSTEDQNMPEKTKIEEGNVASKTESDNNKNGQDGNTEQNPQKDSNTEQENFVDPSNEGTTNSDQVKDVEQNLDKPTGDEQQDSDGNSNAEQETKSDSDKLQDDEEQGQVTETEKYSEENTGQPTTENQEKQTSEEVFPDAAQSDLLNETTTQTGAWSTQTTESKNEMEIQAASQQQQETDVYRWKLCNVTAGIDYIPCLDNEEAIKKLKGRSHYEHRERHCPDESPTCLVPLPEGYKRPISWPNSRNKIWFSNIPRTKLADYKGHQNWVKVTGEYLTFPGGGTQFINGALHYIDSIQESWPDIAWGKRSRVILDVGCGVASFGGYLFDRDVLTMSFAPKDEHEAQVQFALERGIPAFSAVMGTKRLPFPGMVFDVIHCARCRVPWHIEGGMLLLELNRLLRPGGYFVWSATPVYRTVPEDVEIWKAMSALTKSMCWDMVNKSKDELNEVGFAIFKKPINNNCYQKRPENNPPLCQESDDPNAAWSVPLQACMHKLPVDNSIRGSQWPELWPQRLEKSPYWLNNSQVGVYGKPAAEDFKVDYEHWKQVVNNSYLNGMGIKWSSLRNVMDMRAVYGGFAAALKDLNVWVMNIVSVNSPDTLPVIYERGLFGMYHDWCESFSSYPRTYDLLHADHLFSKLKQRCQLIPVMAEVDRLLRPEGKLIVRDNIEIVNEIETIAKSLHWEIRMTFSKQSEGLLFVHKTSWRPTEVETSSTSLS